VRRAAAPATTPAEPRPQPLQRERLGQVVVGTGRPAPRPDRKPGLARLSIRIGGVVAARPDPAAHLEPPGSGMRTSSTTASCRFRSSAASAALPSARGGHLVAVTRCARGSARCVPPRHRRPRAPALAPASMRDVPETAIQDSFTCLRPGSAWRARARRTVGWVLTPSERAAARMPATRCRPARREQRLDKSAALTCAGLTCNSRATAAVIALWPCCSSAALERYGPRATRLGAGPGS